MSLFTDLSLQERSTVFAVLHGTYCRAGLEVPRPTLHASVGIRGHG